MPMLVLSEDEKKLACARAAHEANRAYCAGLGDNSQVGWDDAPAWQKDSCLAGVEGVLAGNTPRMSHASLAARKGAHGWTYGPIKDPEKKQHPCMVSFEELPAHQRVKDEVFVEVVRGMAKALGLPMRVLRSARGS